MVSSFSPPGLQDLSHSRHLSRHQGSNGWSPRGIPNDFTLMANVPIRSNLLRIQSGRFRERGQSFFLRLKEIRSRMILRMRTLLMVAFMVSVVWGNTFSGLGKIPASHAASTPTAASPTFHEKVVENYIKNHMFDDEKYDPVASTYREAHFDNTVGSHAIALQEITTSVIGESGKMVGRQAEKRVNPVSSLLMSLVSFLEKRGLSQMSAILLLTAIVFSGAPVIFLVGSMAISMMFKRGINREMKARYGASYTIDATIKKEEDVEAPDDEDDEEDDEDDNDTEDKSM